MSNSERYGRAVSETEAGEKKKTKKKEERKKERKKE